MLLGYSVVVLGQNKTDLSFSFNHLALFVYDLSISSEFYKNVINLKTIPLDLTGFNKFTFKIQTNIGSRLMTFLKKIKSQYTTINEKVIQLQEPQLLQKLLHANPNVGFVFNKCRIKSAE